jgi:anti-sigma factor RsiW
LAGLGAAAAAALFIVNFGLTTALGVDPALEVYPDQPGVGADLKLGDGRIVRESLSWHRRQVPIEVTGPDSQRINHWFKGKVDFRVKAPRFDRRGLRDVNLLGARLSNVRDRQAAYVVYEVDGSKVSVLIFDRNGERPRPVMRAAERGFYNAGGYNVAVVEQQGVTYSITSDLPQETHVKLVNAAFRP